MRNTHTLLLRVLSFGVVALIAFFGIVVYLYRKSGKFRQSVLVAFLFVLQFFGPGAISRAHGSDAEAFTTPPASRGRQLGNSDAGYFARGKRGSDSGSGPEKPNNNSKKNNELPDSCPNPESVDATQNRFDFLQG